MHAGRFILSQVLDLIDRKTLARLATHFNANPRVRHFGVRQQLICMVFAQLTWREGLRDIVECLNAKHEALYHLGFREPVAKSTLADANERRDWRLWEALALSLIPKARSLYEGEDLGLDLENTIYALDSTTIDLSLTMFPWATFRSTKSGIKVHTQIDLRGPIPVCVFVSPASMHDASQWPILIPVEGCQTYEAFIGLLMIMLAGNYEAFNKPFDHKNQEILLTRRTNRTLIGYMNDAKRCADTMAGIQLESDGMINWSQITLSLADMPYNSKDGFFTPKEKFSS